MARTPLIAGNWKMHKTTAEAADLVRALLAEPMPPGVEVAVCPPFAALGAVRSVLGGSTVRLGAQDMHWEAQGAFTGAVSPVMLRDLGCHYVIVGHSERRQLFGETDESAARKTGAAFAHGLVPILCVGERLEERDAGQTEAVVIRQTVAGTQHVDGARASALVVAYEPVWAIGTGISATKEQAQEAHRFIRDAVERFAGHEAATGMRIIYGGSVTPENSAPLLGQPDIDGALVGGASLKADAFMGIVRAARE
jgi:triosephosphate isomerase